jgi:hypothetical protein
MGVRKICTCTSQIKETQKNADVHPRLQRNLNSRSQCWSDTKHTRCSQRRLLLDDDDDDDTQSPRPFVWVLLR